MEPRIKLWIERDGKVALSDYRVRLLELVRETGSLARAASAMHLSYRRAWGKIKELEQNLGVPLVSSEVGGAGGGHTSLTPEAVLFLARYARFQEGMAASLEREYTAAFGTPPSSSRPPGR